MRDLTAAAEAGCPATVLECYHCGETVPAGADYRTPIGGELRAMCCPGCRAVASLISSNGLESFYLKRSALNARPDPAVPHTAQHYAVYDDPRLTERFSETDEHQTLHARLLIGGISCAACTWLIEQALTRLPGVVAASVNLSQSRLDVSIDPKKISLGQIFQAVDALGYKARPFLAKQLREQLSREHKTHLRQLAVAGLGMMQAGMFAIALHAGDLQGMETEYRDLLRWVSLLVASFVLLYSARPFFNSAWRHLRVGVLVMDLPVALALGLAWSASALATMTRSGQVYFDSVVMFTFFLLLGRFLERRARRGPDLDWFDAEASLPAAVKVLRSEEWQTVARQQLREGERILIPQGETIPADARIAAGASAVDESTFNGEPTPRTVGIGDTVYAGTLNASSVLQAVVTGPYEHSRLAALQQSVERAQVEKPALVRLADRVAGRFVAMVLLLCAFTAASWYFIDPSRMLWISLSVLVISCPCALALATPAALAGAANGLRRSGIIVRGENAIEALSRCTHLIFDKTGTLTKGEFELCDVLPLGKHTEADIIDLAASLQVFSSHPLAAAFAPYPAERNFCEVRYRVGAGLEGKLGGVTYRIGSREFCTEVAGQLPAPPDNRQYWIALCSEKQPLAWLGLRDTVRPEASAVVEAARDRGLQVELLTGDTSNAGASLAEELGIPTAVSGVNPQQKMDHVRHLQGEGAVVAMVGDGLNDAPVLALADASFAVAEATELARTQADFVLLGGDLSAVTCTQVTAWRCRHVIRQNLAWALTYNLCGIPLAAAGYVPPWLAAIGMSSSSLLVVINSLRLNRRKASQGAPLCPASTC